MSAPRTSDQKADVFVDGQAGVAEGPVWDAARSRLVWTDIPAEVVHFTDFSTGADSQVETGGRVGAVVLRSEGGFVLAMENEFVLTGTDVGIPESRTRVTEDPRFRFNDGKCDPAGRFLAGLAGTDGRWATAGLYRFDPDGTTTEVVSGISCSNGIGWSPEGSIMYYVDTPTYRIDCFDYDLETGVPSNRRLFAPVTEGYGRPDGLCVDAEGCVWVAIWGGYEVRRFSPEGTLLSRVSLPVSLVSSVAFGGPQLATLFITSSRDIPKHQIPREPLAGAIFRMEPGVTGLPVAAFAG
ncbi:MAG: SMP-30/gluconolactonase/LRE family protein [Actinomycetota bacterium]|nr:SMP-30/gluconolactonase/LRE family protein [Actinomycetota bacterium]